MLRRALPPSAAALVLAAPGSPIAAQPTLMADLGLNSAFVWRGVTSTNRPVVNPMVLLGVPAGGATLSFGAWANVEPAHYDGARDISVLGGRRGPLVTSSQVWAEALREVGAAAITLGATRYLYPNVGGLSATYATNEVYGIAAFSAPLAPRVSVYYDVQKVHGAYAELGVGHAVALPREHALDLSAAVGYSAGQEADAASGDAAYFARGGVTHVDLGAKTSFAVGGVSVSPTAHVVFGRDDLARVTAPGVSRGVKSWVGASLTWQGTLGR